MNLSTEFFPLCVALVRIDGFGIEVGCQHRTSNDSLLHAHMGDVIQDPITEGDTLTSRNFESGAWLVVERTFREFSGKNVKMPNTRWLVLGIRQP